MEAFNDGVRNCFSYLYGINTHTLTLEQMGRLKLQVKPASHDLTREFLYEGTPVRFEPRGKPVAEAHMESDDGSEGRRHSLQDSYEQNWNSAQLQENHVKVEKRSVPAPEDNHVDVEKRSLPAAEEILKRQLPRTEVGLSGTDTNVELQNVRDDIRVIKTVLLGFAEKTDVDVKKSLKFDETKMWKEVVKEMEGPLNTIVQGILDGILEESVMPVIRELKTAVSRMELKVPKSSRDETVPNIRDAIDAAVRQEFERMQTPAVTYAKLEDGWMHYLSEECSAGDHEIHEMNEALAPKYSMDQDDQDTEDAGSDDLIASLKQELAENKKLVENLQMELRGRDETIKGLQRATSKRDTENDTV